MEVIFNFTLGNLLCICTWSCNQAYFLHTRPFIIIFNAPCFDQKLIILHCLIQKSQQQGKKCK